MKTFNARNRVGRSCFTLFLIFLLSMTVLPIVPQSYASTLQAEAYVFGNVESADTTSTSCSDTGQTKTNYTGQPSFDVNTRLERSDASASCWRGYMIFDISDVPHYSTITKVVVNFYIETVYNMTDYTGKITGVGVGSGGWPDSWSTDTLYDAIHDGVNYGDDFDEMKTTGSKAIELDSQANIDIQNTVNTLTQDWFTLGFLVQPETRTPDALTHQYDIWVAGSPIYFTAYLEIEYTSGSLGLTLQITPAYIYRSVTSISISGFYKEGGVCTSNTANQVVVVESNYTGTWYNVLSLSTDSYCLYGWSTTSESFTTDDTNGTYHFRAKNFDESIYSSIVTVIVNITEYEPTTISVTLTLSPSTVTVKGQTVEASGRVLYGGQILSGSYNRYVCIESNATRYSGTTDTWVLLPNGCDHTDQHTALYSFTISTSYLLNTNGTYWYRVQDNHYSEGGTYSANRSFTIGIPEVQPTEPIPTPANATWADAIRGLGVTLGIGAIGGGFFVVILIMAAFIAAMQKNNWSPQSLLMITGLVGLASVAMMAMFIPEMLWILVLFAFVVVLIFAVKFRGAMSGSEPA